jgi:hypothetical protein
VHNDPLVICIQVLRQLMDESAKAGMDRPKKEPFEHGVEVGKYQGMARAVQEMDAVLRRTEAGLDD